MLSLHTLGSSFIPSVKWESCDSVYNGKNSGISNPGSTVAITPPWLGLSWALPTEILITFFTQAWFSSLYPKVTCTPFFSPDVSFRVQTLTIAAYSHTAASSPSVPGHRAASTSLLPSVPLVTWPPIFQPTWSFQSYKSSTYILNTCWPPAPHWACFLFSIHFPYTFSAPLTHEKLRQQQLRDTQTVIRPMCHRTGTPKPMSQLLKLYPESPSYPTLLIQIPSAPEMSGTSCQ